MTRSTVFYSNRTQAVRIPKALAFPDHIKKVEVLAVGNALVIYPQGATWRTFFEGDRATSDFMATRDQPEQQVREVF